MNINKNRPILKMRLIL